MPYASPYQSARVLDPSRLGNQAYRECRTLINGGWPNHPASKMWSGHEHHLALYALACLEELRRRGRFYPGHILFFERKLIEFPDTGLPSWVGDERLHSSHRAVLLWKDLDWYGRFGWSEEPAEHCFWA